MTKICPVCGKREIGDRAEMCNLCNHKKNRKVYQSLGICPICRKEKLFGDEKECPECRADRGNMVNAWQNANRERYNLSANEYHRKIYAERKAKGICTRCGKRASLPGKGLCGICRDRHNRHQAKARNTDGIPRSERVAYGLCYFCGSELDRKGRSCTKCAEKNIANLKKVDNSHHPWRKPENSLYWQWKREKKKLREADIV